MCLNVSESTPSPVIDSQRILVTLCTYNELENIRELLPEIWRYLPQADVLVVDDNSPDGTGDYVRSLQSEEPRLQLLQRAGKLGLGTALLAAFRYGVEHQYDLLINLDADFSHPPRYLPSLLAASSTHDVVIGSRYCPGGSVEGWGLARHTMSRGINLYARTLLGLKTLDNSGSYRCYRVPLLARVDWSGTRATGYAFMEEVLFRLKQAGATFTEVPIHFEERRFGVTKISWKEALQAGVVLLQLSWEGVAPPRR